MEHKEFKYRNCWQEDPSDPWAAVGLSRPKFADLLGVPPTTLKNYELGYREVGGAFLVALVPPPRICTSSPSGCWLTRKSPKSGQIGPDDKA